MKSKQWKDISDKIRQVKPTCEQCKTYKSEAVHHKTYNNLGNEKYTDLLALCRHCHTKLHGEKTTMETYYSRNKEKCKANVQAYQKKNKEKIAKYKKKWNEKNKHAWDIKNTYNMTIEEYNTLLEAQEHSCAICGRHKSNFNRKLSVDHDHTTGAIRGLLCMNCNHGLGKFYDSTDNLNSATLYLQKYKTIGIV